MRDSERQSVVVLLGAGASMGAGIPNVVQFVESFRKDLTLEGGPATILLRCLDQIQDAWKTAANSNTGIPTRLDLERLYELLELLLGAPQHHSLPLDLPSDFPERCRIMELLAWRLKKYVQQRCMEFSRDRLRYLEPLLDLADLGLSVILTLNYDTCIETLLEARGVAWTDGLPPDGSDAAALAFEDDDCTIQLLKLHGSVSWYSTPAGKMRRVLRSSQHSVGAQFGAARTMTHEAVMIYPTLNKALVHGPFPTLMARAQKALSEAGIVLAIGYGFADVHVRRLVLEGLDRNPCLRLIIVNPRPETIVTSLFRDANRPEELRGRVGLPSLQREPDGSYSHGYVERFLEGNGLKGHLRDWRQGTPPPDPVPHIARRLKKQGQHWMLRFPIAGGVRYMTSEGAKFPGSPNPDAGCRVWFFSESDNYLHRLDTSTGEIEASSIRFESPRGLAHDPLTDYLYVVENTYRSVADELQWPLVRGTAGLGRVWRIDPATEEALPISPSISESVVSRLAALPAQGRQFSEWRSKFEGLLSWPSRIVVEEHGSTVLFTESRRLRRLDLNTRILSTPLRMPVSMNVRGLALGPRNKVLLVESGVHPHGHGRLMIGDLVDGTVRILREEPSRLDDVLYLPRCNTVLASVGKAWPDGRVFALRLGSTTDHLGSWEGLDRPRCLAIGSDGRVLVATANGVAELDLDQVGCRPEHRF